MKNDCQYILTISHQIITSHFVKLIEIYYNNKLELRIPFDKLRARMNYELSRFAELKA